MKVSIDLLPGYEEERIRAGLFEILERAGEPVPLPRLLGGFTHEKVASYLVRRSGYEKVQSLPSKKETAQCLAGLIKHLELTVDGVREISRSQICVGGVSPAEVNGQTLESKICPGLYLTGEELDIDGPCGGYNLQWAWSSGMTAGMAAGRGKLQGRAAVPDI